jgi:hypothetical protein
MTCACAFVECHSLVAAAVVTPFANVAVGGRCQTIRFGRLLRSASQAKPRLGVVNTCPHQRLAVQCTPTMTATTIYLMIRWLGERVVHSPFYAQRARRLAHFCVASARANTALNRVSCQPCGRSQRCMASRAMCPLLRPCTVRSRAIQFLALG